MRTILTTTLGAIGALMAAGAVEATDIRTTGSRHQLTGDKLFEFHGCVNCHGAKGRNPITKKVPAIGGKDSAYIYKEATDILAGRRDSEDAKLMHSALSSHASCDPRPPTLRSDRSPPGWRSRANDTRPWGDTGPRLAAGVVADHVAWGARRRHRCTG
jgi:cytochrome c553